ncbi:reverse transcriptase-like protein, partial [Escherichia coli]|uniref:reverse transcriptase-like protein n=1 Tax=Escherichia coli TaxID=562 RepID=UPI0021D8B70A
MLIVDQLTGRAECKDDVLRIYHEDCLQLLKEFRSAVIEHVPRDRNEEANKLAQHASGYRPIQGTMALELAANDWRKEIADYLKDPSKKVDRRVRFHATKYVLLEDDLFYRTIDGVLLKCLGT